MTAATVLLTGAGFVHPEPGGAEPWFDPVPHLGARGWRYLTPATRYVLAAAGLAMSDAGFHPGSLADEDVGVAIGTNFAAAPVVARFDRIVADEGADAISPAEAPAFSVNIPASQISMRHGLRAFNLTLTNPMVAGLEAVLTMRSALLRGRARAGIAGAVEERPADTAAEAIGAGAAGEGACCVVLERADDAAPRTGPEVAGGFSVFAAPGLDPVALLGARLDALLAGATGPLPYAPPAGSFRLRDQVDDACRSWAKQAGIELLEAELTGADGRDFTVSPLLQLAGLAAAPAGGLVLAASPHGHVAAVLLRPPA
ncbi:MAG TPA: beta-ketoacyl synthase N-terminal-like domain-containing protein [Jatrophihabitans sp.]|uniref:beta-ketoacyl synthase N-terminal-like domain-containing protein n=1 Tax=Jatrophihabitans sp. TaxID=1932789 RepID=UPI002EFC579C